MKKIGVICVMAVMLSSLAGIAQAVNPGIHPKMVFAKPFVRMSVKPDKLDLGIIPPVGFGSLPAKLDVHIVANCPHQVRASFSLFTQQRGRVSRVSIQPEHMSVVINGVDVPITGRAVTIISSAGPTPAGGVHVPVDMKFSLASSLLYPAGPYKGNLILTIMPGSN